MEQLHTAELLWAVLEAENLTFIAEDFDITDNAVFEKIRKENQEVGNLCDAFEFKFDRKISAEDGMWVLSQIAFGKSLNEYSERTGRKLAPMPIR